MNILVCETAEAAADLVAQEILAALGRKPELVLGLATGSTPIGVYARLVHAHREQQVDFSGVRTFNLDVYVCLPEDHPQSYRSFMQEHLFQGIELAAGQIHFPPSEGKELRRRCSDYEQAIRDAGGIDIQLLGIGTNGHIGFNEPTSSLASRTRLKTLTEKTLRDNARFYGPDEEQPQVAATMGVGTILEAKRILLQSFGRRKAEAVRAAVEGAISSFWPASALQLHPDVTLYLDPESASLLTMGDYYRRAQENQQDLEERGLL